MPINLRSLFVIVSLAFVTSVSTPEITNVAPAAPAPSTRPQTLTVTGKDLLSGLTLHVMTPAGQTIPFQGGAISARSDTSFQVSVVLDTPGVYSLKVINTDGGMSTPFALKVQPAAATANTAAPFIDRVTPDVPTKSPQTQVLRVEGRNFARGLSAILTDPAGNVLPTPGVDKVTPTSCEVTVLLEQSGDYSLVLKSAAGAESNVIHVQVK